MKKQPAKDGANQALGVKCDTIEGLCVNSDVAGTGLEGSKPQNGERLRFGDKAIDFKACKRVYNSHGIKTRSLEVLSILWLYFALHDRFEHGVNLQSLKDFSGFGTRWEERLKYDLGLLVESGCVDKVAFNGGHRYLISQKGYYILKVWEQYRVEVLDEMTKRAITHRIRHKTAELSKEIREKRKGANGRYQPKSSSLNTI